MARRYSITEARSNLPAIVDQAESGREVELTRRGKPVAVVMSLQQYARLRGERERFGAAYRRFLASHDLHEVGLDDDAMATVRDRSPGRSARF